MSNSGNFQAPSPFEPFEYGDIQIREAGYIGITPCFTRRAIGEWLEYKRPQEAIDKIIRRNPHIDNPTSSVHPKMGCTEIETPWAVPVKLTATDGKKYTTVVYTPIGLQLIVFESRQPKAVRYKIAVARLVNDIMTGEFTRKLVNGFISGKISTARPALVPWVAADLATGEQKQRLSRAFLAVACKQNDQ